MTGPTELDEARRMLSVGAAVGAMPIHYADAARLLLASEEENRKKVEEAVRLMKPGARAANGYGHTVPDEYDMPAAMPLTLGDLRAQARFVEREEKR